MIPVIIPARFGSTRFPEKPLAMILGKSLIERVCESSARAVGRDQVFVATDDSRIESHVNSLGFRSIMTSLDCETGSDRVADAMRALGVSKAVNVQGDEPMVSSTFISEVIEKLRVSKNIINGFGKISDQEDPSSTSLPKIVLRPDGTLIYASRSLIPGDKNNLAPKTALNKQVCVYGFNLDQMNMFGAGFPKTPLEKLEDIEILRFIEMGITVQMLETKEFSLAVDYPHDVAKVERALDLAGLV